MAPVTAPSCPSREGSAVSTPVLPTAADYEARLTHPPWPQQRVCAPVSTGRRRRREPTAHHDGHVLARGQRVSASLADGGIT